MARILDEDLQTVRERSRIDDVVGAWVTLRPAGGGALTGLCPFHDEKTPSFRVTPSRGFFKCFGCGKGGDVITFVEEINHVSFMEAVEWLADRAGIQLRYTEGGPQAEPGLRMRVLEANRIAAEFFAAQLDTPAARPGRDFLKSRGFGKDAAEQFAVGWAPQDGRALGERLRAGGFTAEELVKANLVRENGGWDVFQGRLVWPIKDSGRAVLGFGARRILEDDRMPAKYVNTGETVVYKKSNVLYGLDLARGNIAKKNQAVVVEGYTDVMACHLAGVDTAVASCGTAFGEGHARIIQRLVGAADVRPGEIIFTFDGDAAGQAAALKVFELDEAFSAQTYVAVEPGGLDPCDLRVERGDAALRDLVGRRIPLYRFVMKNRVDGFDLDRVDGQLGALRAVAGLVRNIRDAALVEGYIREIAQLTGLDPNTVRKEVRGASRKPPPGPAPSRGAAAEAPAPDGPAQPEDLPMPDARDRRLAEERAVARLMLNRPELFTEDFNGLSAKDFAHPAYRRIAELALAATGPRGGTQWARSLIEGEPGQTLANLAVELGVEPELREPSAEYVGEYATQVRLKRLAREISQVKSRLTRMNPLEDPEYQELFRALVNLEARRNALFAQLPG